VKYIQANANSNRKDYRVVIVVSLFNTKITQELLNGTLERLKELGVNTQNVLTVEVPGAVEIPFTLQRVLKTYKFDVAISLGAVIRGETSHYDYVCQQVSVGVQQVSLQLDIPIIFGVLTTENEDQAFARLGGVHGHKGRDAADAAIAMLEVLSRIC
jgi:6,7-dimethyl-8-ribityllumazine synthase